jgi:N-acetylglucosamine-6-phosphate deacetylase
VLSRKTRVALERIPTYSNDDCPEFTQFCEMISEITHFLGAAVSEIFRIEKQNEVMFATDVAEAKWLASMELNFKLGCLNASTEHTFSLKQRAPHNEGR